MSDPIVSASTSKKTSVATIESKQLPTESSINTTTSMKTASSNQRVGTLENNIDYDDDNDNHKEDKIGSNWSKFGILLWKDFKLSMRRPGCFGVELLSMILLVAGLSLFFRYTSSKIDHMDRVIYNPFCIVSMNKTDFCVDEPFFTDGKQESFGKYILIYSPGNNTAIQEIMGPFKSVFKEVKEFKDAKQMEAYYDTQGANSVFAGVQFNDGLFNKSDFGNKTVDLCLRFPGELRYLPKESSRVEVESWKTESLFPMDSVAGPRSPTKVIGAIPNYHKEGFLYLQYLLSLFITLRQMKVPIPNNIDIFQLKGALENKTLPFINMRRFPHETWEIDRLPAIMMKNHGIFAVFINTAIMLILTPTLSYVVLEKENQLKELMKIEGLPNWMHWLAWYLKLLIIQTIVLFITVALLKITIIGYPVIVQTPFIVIWMLLFLYICACISFGFFIVSFFSKPFRAQLTAYLIILLTMMAPQFLGDLSDSNKIAVSFLFGPLTALVYGVEIIFKYELRSEGLTLNKLWTPVLPDETISLGLVIFIFFLQAVVYMLLAIYVEAIFPGSWGVPKKWNFLCTSKFWSTDKNHYLEGDIDNSLPQGEFFEPEPAKLRPGIEIRSLRKEFHHKTAVKNVSLNMYEGQVTVLLGHNGAGKTTTISMLTGMYPPTSGTAFIRGYDIRVDMDSVRASLGTCAQNNIIFDSLTVEEHFDFFCRLKGLDKKKRKVEVNKFLELLELKKKRHKYAGTLSGGMKRKLCVGIAMIGDTKVVMLDEPTSGMDPSARRAMWDFLLTQKKGRTILLTTHFMDEADLLGDRIAIMVNGEIKCCGSSFFLKKKYGAGYSLVIEKSANCNPQNVTQLLRKFMPNIQPASNSGSELTYILPENQIKIFEPLLANLEQNSKNVGVDGYGISLTTLEEVFIKVGAAEHHKSDNTDSAVNSKNIDIPACCRERPIIPYWKLFSYQFAAMSLKTLLSHSRSPIILIIHILLPFLFLLIGVLTAALGDSQESIYSSPKLPLTLKGYNNPIILVDGVGHSGSYALELQHLIQSVYTEADVSVEKDILATTKKYPGLVKRRYLGGASFSPIPDNYSKLFDTNFTVYFNNEPLHTPGVLLGIAMNTMYRKMVGCKVCGINFFNHPMPYNSTTKQDLVQGKYLIIRDNKFVGNQLPSGFDLLFTFFIFSVIQQRSSNSKHLQFASGVKVYIFWLTTFFWDMLVYMIAVLLVIILLVSYKLDGFSTGPELERMVVILVYCACLGIPMIYLLGFLFGTGVGGWTAVFGIFYGGSLIINFVSVMVTLPEEAIYIFLVLPTYSMKAAILDTYQMYSYNKICQNHFKACRFIFPNFTDSQCLQLIPNLQSLCKDFTFDYYQWPRLGILKHIVIGCVTGLLLFLIVLFMDYHVFSILGYLFLFQKKTRQSQEDDPDVLKEKDKIRNTPKKELFAQYSLVVKDLTKYYGSFLAVNGVCVGVQPAECFGLLGLNGAGKTTTFKMLTGEIMATSGDAYIWGKSIKSDLKSVQQYIGYCPQFDALIENMTAKETLVMYGMVRGLSINCSKLLAEKLAEDFDFTEHLNKPITNLSGGNKRKVSSAVVMVGEPPILFMDEPTTGMDPATKRVFWNTIIAQRNSGKTIVLTSHSMDECEALCTRLAIMVNGNFKCLGSVQHLKDTFADGYTLTVKIKKIEPMPEENIRNVVNYVERSIPGMKLRERHDELFVFYMDRKSMPLSRMFGIMEKGKASNLNIEDYALGQCSLEQVKMGKSKLPGF